MRLWQLGWFKCELGESGWASHVPLRPLPSQSQQVDHVQGSFALSDVRNVPGPTGSLEWHIQDGGKKETSDYAHKIRQSDLIVWFVLDKVPHRKLSRRFWAILWHLSPPHFWNPTRQPGDFWCSFHSAMTNLVMVPPKKFILGILIRSNFGASSGHAYPGAHHAPCLFSYQPSYRGEKN